MDYVTLMQEIAKLPVDTPAIVEHLQTEKQYDMATKAVTEFALRAGLHIEGLVWMS